MKLAPHINNFSWPGSPFGATLAEIARSVDPCGFDRIGVVDHLWQHPIMGRPEAEELERSLNLPQSITRPHPPILIAGDGEKKTLRLVARNGVEAAHLAEQRAGCSGEALPNVVSGQQEEPAYRRRSSRRLSQRT